MSEPDQSAPNEIPSVVKEWARLVNNVIAKKKLSPLTIAKESRGALPYDKLTHWLAGNDVPRSQEQHNTLMNAIGLKYGPSSLISKNSLEATMAGLRNEIETAYGNALKSVKDRPEATNNPWAHRDAIRRVPRAINTPRSAPTALRDATGRVHDAAGTPRRIYENNGEAQLVPKHLAREEYEGIAQETKNFAEFLRCHRLAQSLTQEALAKGSDVRIPHGNITSYEAGDSSPSPSSLYALQMALFPMPDGAEKKALRTRFEDLCITNRLAIIEHESNSDHKQNEYKTGQHLPELPPIYWRAAIDRLLNADNPAADTIKVPSPPWADKILPIPSQNAYCKAMRHLLSLNAEEVTKDMDITESAIHRIEAGDYRANRDITSDHLNKLAKYYEKKQQSLISDEKPLPFLSWEDSARPIFDKAIFNQLDIITSEKKSFQDRAAERRKPSAKQH